MYYSNSLKKSPIRDWHRADIIAALRKAGTSLRRLAEEHGYKNLNQLSTALDRSWPKGEEIIAAGIRRGSDYPDIQPCEIWPTRYSDDSKSTRRASIVHGKNASRN